MNNLVVSRNVLYLINVKVGVFMCLVSNNIGTGASSRLGDYFVDITCYKSIKISWLVPRLIFS